MELRVRGKMPLLAHGKGRGGARHVTSREFGPIGTTVYPFTQPTWLI